MQATRSIPSVALLLIGIAGFVSPTRAASFSPQFDLDGEIGTLGIYDYSRLSALPAITQMVTYTAAGTPTTDTFTGTGL